MHIPDGYLSPQTYVPLYSASMIFLGIALKRLKKEMDIKHVPYIAMAGAFSFLIQMFNIPIPGGTTGHAVGGAIIAILLGPWTAVVCISIVLIIQALVFGDGGITAIGANCFNIAVVIPFISYYIFKVINGNSHSKARLSIAGFISGYLGLTMGAILTAVELGIQPLIARSPDGTPLYSPYPLEIAVPIMAVEHLMLFGIVEGVVTLFILKYFYKNEPSLIYAIKGGVI